MSSFVENRNKLNSFYWHLEALESKEVSDLKNEFPTKRELRLRYSVKKLLETLDNSGELNVSNLMKKSGLYSNTLVRIIPILKKRRIINERRLQEQSNQKLYSLNLFRAIVFLNNLFAQERVESFVSIHRQLRQKAIKLNNGKIPMPSLDLKEVELGDLLSSKITISDNLQKKYQVQVTGKHILSQMNPYLVDEIIMNYVSEKYCHNCFENGSLSILKRILDVKYCRKCGMEFYDVDPHSQIISRHSIR